jgi:hypothetical protein
LLPIYYRKWTAETDPKVTVVNDRYAEVRT